MADENPMSINSRWPYEAEGRWHECPHDESGMCLPCVKGMARDFEKRHEAVVGALEAIRDYEPIEVRKDAFAYDRLLENMKDAAEKGLAALKAAGKSKKRHDGDCTIYAAPPEGPGSPELGICTCGYAHGILFSSDCHHDYHAALMSPERREQDRDLWNNRPVEAALLKAAKAFQALNVCYRVGKMPTEKLFKALEAARETLKAAERET